MKKIILLMLAVFTAFTVNANSVDTINVEILQYIYYESESMPVFFANGDSVLRYNDVTYVPVNSMAESFGYDVAYDEDTATYNLTKAVFDGSIKFGDYKYSTHTTLEDLLINPEKYIGCRVSVEGYLRVGFEEDYLFLTYDDYKYSNYNSTVALAYRSYMPNALNTTIGRISTISGRYVKVQGIFDKLWDKPERYYLSDINLVEAKGEGTRLQEYHTYVECEAPTLNTAKICDAKLSLDGTNYPAVNEHGEAVPVFEYDNKVYMPIRAFANAFGLDVKYNEEKDVVIIGKNFNRKSFSKDNKSSESESVSIINLFSKPQKYEGTYIDVHGALKDGKLYQDTSCTSDYITLQDFDGLDDFDGAFVWVFGTFKKENGEYMICDIDLMYEQRDSVQYPFELYFDQWNDAFIY